MDAQQRARELASHKNGESDLIDGSRFSSAEHLEQEWGQRVRRPFPGYSTQGTYKVIALAGIDRETAKWLSLGEIYEIAIDKCATERAATPLTKPQQQIVDTVRKAGKRLTTAELLSAMDAKGLPSSSATKQQFAFLVQLGELTNAHDNYGKGYGLPEWS